MLAVQEVTKSYGKTAALRGATLSVRRGELFGLLGPNGAGKTTLMNLLAGLTAPDRGQILLDGQPIGPQQPATRRRVGLATQDLAIYPELSARENLLFFGALYGTRGAALQARAHEMLRLAALEDRAEARVGTFSGGMKRRLNLAVALMHEPELLLLDEPTTGVDPQSRNHLFEAVRRLNESGLTVIYTSHYMEEVQALCPRLAILDHGRIIAEDTLSLLLARLPTVLRGVPPAGLSVEEFAARPWVQSVRRIGPALEWTTTHLAEFLPHCPPGFTDLVIEPPTLERVFLTLTGTALRDE